VVVDGCCCVQGTMVTVVVGFGFSPEGQQPTVVKRSFGIVIKPYANTFEKPC
jgi:hypothetical protein